MYNYESFKEVIKRGIYIYFPDVPDLEIRESENVKVNVNKDGYIVTGTGLAATNEGDKFSPVIYFDDLYERYQAGESIESLLTNVSERITKVNKHLSEIPDVMNIIINEPDKIFFQLINTDANKKMLEQIPHRDFMDMSIIYRTFVARFDEGIGSVIINNNLMADMKLNENELYNYASENTPKLFPAYVEPVYSTIKASLGEMSDDLPFPSLEDSMFVITNKEKVNGAGAMLYTDALDKVADRMGTDLYILPSSVHEVIAVSTAVADLDELKETVHDVNKYVLNPSEFLSDNVYKYDRKEKKITQETDVKQEKTKTQEIKKTKNRVM